MRIRILALALALGALGAASAPTVALAEDEDEENASGYEAVYNRTAFYFILQGTDNIGTFRGKPESDISVSTEHSLGAKGAFGYRINPYLGAELEVNWVDGFRANVSGSHKDFNGGGITAQVKGYPLTGRFQPFGVLGLGVGAFEIRHDKQTKYKKAQAEMMVRFGGGFNYWFTEQVGMVFDATYAWPTGATGKLDDLDYATFGWGFVVRFVAE
jgi:hypothetical protein